MLYVVLGAISLNENYAFDRGAKEIVGAVMRAEIFQDGELVFFDISSVSAEERYTPAAIRLF